jgi:uncharacterized membrane protein (UPF0127 family)
MIRNVSSNKILAKETKLCDSILSKAKGLMFSKRIKDKGLVFVFKKDERWSLHMLFVFFPIDVLWLNKDCRIVDMKESFAPFSVLAVPKEKARFVIELPANTIKNSDTIIGDKVSF